MQMSKDALAFGSEASNKYVSDQESSVRRMVKLRNEDNKNQGLGERGTRESYADVLMNEGRDIFNQNRKIGQGFRPYEEGDIFKGFDEIAAEQMSKDPKIRAQIDALVSKMLPDLEADKNPEAGAAQKASDDAAKAKGTTFKGPEGFSNVVGVGANPVIEAMTMQLEEARKQTALLELIAQPATGGGVPVDFTKSAEARLTRSYMPE
jgi:hypothetical protein